MERPVDGVGAERPCDDGAVAADSRGSSFASLGSSAPSCCSSASPLLFAFEQPPFVAPDETAHVGYAHEIAGFDLPEVTEFPDVPDSAVQWQAERESGS